MNASLPSSLAQNTLYIFGAANALAIIVVYLFYPETANVIFFTFRITIGAYAVLILYLTQRTLEDIDYLFTSDSWFAWKAEEAYVTLKAQAMVEYEAGLTHSSVEKPFVDEPFVKELWLSSLIE